MLNNKLCIDARMYNSSGIGTYIRQLIPYLLGNFQVTLLGDTEVLKDYKSAASLIEFKSPIYSIGEQRQFKKVIPATDLFWSPHFNVPYFSVPARKRIVTIHDVFHLAHYHELSLKQKIYAKLVINRAVKISDTIITVSDFSNQEIQKYTGAKAGKIHVIHNGVKQDRLVKDIELIRTKYNLPSKYILYVGNVKPHKNLKGLLGAYLNLPLHIQKDYKVLIVGKIDGFVTGDEALFSWIEDTPVLKNNIVFAGFVADEDMDTIYANASLLILPSLYEGFGLPPFEAMLNECPVLASNIPSLTEVCGEAATYFDPLNPQDIADKISATLDSKRIINKSIENGLNRIKLFQWKQSAEKHIEIFNQIIHHN
jgi:glycosyltransferase involved in cell wall biosynthesis